MVDTSSLHCSINRVHTLMSEFFLTLYYPMANILPKTYVITNGAIAVNTK